MVNDFPEMTLDSPRTLAEDSPAVFNNNLISLNMLPESNVPKREAKNCENEVIKKPGNGAGTIMLIEDEEMVMDVSSLLLDHLGYRVLQAKTGMEAINIAKTFNGEIDLTLLDVGLPDIAGNKLYHLIKEIRPDLKVMVCSGYAIDGPAQQIIDAGAQGFIQKPYALSFLAEKLKETIGQ